MSLRVLYDLSLLGFCKDDPARITGMPRMILEQAVRLQTAPECEVDFCATEDPADACRFMRAHPALAQTRLLAWPEGAAAPDPMAFRDAQVFHTPHSAIPDEVRRHPNVSVVQTVHDLIPFLLPETMTAEYRDYYANILRRIRREDLVITISHSAKADFCQHTGFAEDRVHVVSWAANEALFRPCREAEQLAATRAKYGIPAGPYLLSVCTFEPRKNLGHVVRSFAALLEAQPELSGLSLVLAGGHGWMFEPILAELAGTALPAGRVITTGYVADEDLAPLYSGAAAFVYLSRYEGFGLPPLEAMQCGAPVIVSNVSSLPEVVGSAGILLAPDDQDGLCQAMLDFCRHPGLRTRFGEKSIQQARQFRWERNVRETLEVYRLAAEQKSG